MKILLIGSEGLLGQYLNLTFQDQDLHSLSHSDVDITKFSEVEKIIRKVSPDAIINATAYNDVEGAETKEGLEKANLINGTSVGNLSSIANKIKSILVHFSTDYVFDGSKMAGYTEEESPSPINNYGKSKLLGEQLVKKSAIKFYIIRMSRLFGNSGKSKHSKKSFVDIMLDSAREKKLISVIDDEIGSPTYALDASKMIRKILLEKLPFGIYHITNSGQCTWYEFATQIFLIYKKINPEFKIPRVKPISVTEFNRKAKRPKFSILINTKLPPLRRWELALEDYLNKN